MTGDLLLVDNLCVSLADDPGRKILSGVSFAVKPLSVVALVGGSGCGKTTTGLSILRLLSPALSIDQGRILFKGDDLLSADDRRIRAIRGKEIGMVFQDPLQAFNPVFTVGFQIAEVFRFHTAMTPHEIKAQTFELLSQVGIDDPARVYGSYPHQLSGGMRQRAMIAQAIAVKPSLLIADEPTSSLDVTLQAMILELFVELKKAYRLSILLITHDLGIVGHMADDIVVMNSGSVVESGAKDVVMKKAKHPYTQELMRTLVG